jgi:hypothetical protein
VYYSGGWPAENGQFCTMPRLIKMVPNVEKDSMECWMLLSILHFNRSAPLESYWEYRENVYHYNINFIDHLDTKTVFKLRQHNILLSNEYSCLTLKGLMESMSQTIRPKMTNRKWSHQQLLQIGYMRVDDLGTKHESFSWYCPDPSLL